MFVMAMVTKGYGQKIVTDMHLPNGLIWSREYVLHHFRRAVTPINGKLTHQQVMDSIRRVPDFIPSIGGYASVVRLHFSDYTEKRSIRIPFLEEDRS